MVLPALPPAEDDQVRRARDIERSNREQAAARSLEATSIGEGGLKVIGGSIDIESGGQLNVDGDATFNGNLTVPAGSLNTAGNVGAGGDLTAGDDVIAGDTVQGAHIVATVDASVAGTVAAGAFSTAGLGTFDGGIFSADVKSRTLSVGYDSVYIDASNRMGKSPSALRFKQDLELHSFDPAIVDLMQGYVFRLIGAVAELGEDAPYEVGYIADYLDAIGLGAFVRRDADGEISGLAYERIVMVAIDAIKELRADRAAMRAELDAIKAHLGL